MRSPLSLLSFALVATVFGCSNGTPPPTTPAAPVTVTLDGDAGASAMAMPAGSAEPEDEDPASNPDGGPDYTSCTVDSDCVAVGKAQCCPNGMRAAVNKQSVEAYRGSVQCVREGLHRHRMCPQYRLLDRRIPVCGNDTHHCEMRQPDKVQCTGTGPDVHACPAGSKCDSGGHCAVPSGRSMLPPQLPPGSP
jgi:hypothetical protein